MRSPLSNYDMTADYRHFIHLTNLIANCFIEPHDRQRFLDEMDRKVMEKIALFMDNDRQRIFVDTIEEIKEEFNLEVTDISAMLREFINMSRNIDESVKSFVDRIQEHVQLMSIVCKRLVRGESNTLLWYLDHMAKEVYTNGKYNLTTMTAEQVFWYLKQSRKLNLELLDQTNNL